MHIEDFGAVLIETRDLDPVYVAIVGAGLDRDQLCRLLLAYWCFYHLGVAANLSEYQEGCYWDMMLEAAQNVRSPREHTRAPEGCARWPRGAERRHFRGQKCVDAVRELSVGRPEDWVGQFFNKLVWVDRKVMAEVESWPQFGPWIAFKVADMLERVAGIDVRFDPDIGLMYDEPAKGLELLRWRLYGDAHNNDARRRIMYHQLVRHFSPAPAPPGGDRGCGPQEVETILCKWKAHMGGHYEVGKDIRELRHGLVGWGETAERLLVACPEEVPDGRYDAGRTETRSKHTELDPEVQGGAPGSQYDSVRVLGLPSGEKSDDSASPGDCKFLSVSGGTDLRVDATGEHTEFVPEVRQGGVRFGTQLPQSVEGQTVHGPSQSVCREDAGEVEKTSSSDGSEDGKRQGSPVAIHLRGTGGSGKSTVVRRIMTLYKEEEPIRREGRKQPLYYVLSRPGGRQLAVIGHYETACGGCDTIKTPDEAYQLVRDNLELGRDVVYEGIIIQDETGRLAALHRQIGDNLHVIALSTPVEECLKSIQQRRDERGEEKPLNEKNTRDRAKRLQSGMAKVRFLGIRTYTLDREAAFAKCRELLGL